MMSLRMKQSFILVSFSLCLSLHHSPIEAEEPNNTAGGKTVAGMVEDTDGKLEKNEYISISPNGSITRALCPYTCSMRGIPIKHCQSWQSKMDKTKCYVKDTRISSGAIPIVPKRGLPLQ